MKKLIIALTALMLMALCVCAAMAEPSYYDDLPEYFVCTEHKARGEFILYLYSTTSDGGNPIAHYTNGDIVKMIDKDVKGLNTWSYVVGPDGAVGYTQTKRIVETKVKDSLHYPYYNIYVVVSDTYDGHVYSYGEPASKHDAVKRYQNGTPVKMVNWDVDKKFAFILDDEGYVGYIEKSKLVTWEEWISGNTPTPRPTATPTPMPWYTPTPTPRPWYTPTPTPRPTATPTPRPTATPRTFWNSTGYQLLLTKYNSYNGTYTEVDGTVAYMSQLADGESYRVRLHVTNTTSYGIQYTVSANLNGSTYSWNPYTISAHKSVYHNLGASLTAGSNSLIMYVDGSILCSARYTIVDDVHKTTPTPTPWSYVTPTPNPWNTDPWGQPANITNSLPGHWLRVDENTADDIILVNDGNAVWNGQACTWTQRYGTFTTNTYWGTQTYTYQVNGDLMYLSNTGMGLNRAEYHWITMNYEIPGNWSEAGTAGIITFGADSVLTMGGVNYNWATAGDMMYLTSLWNSERYHFVISGNTMVLYNAADPTRIEKVLVRVK